MYERLSKYLKFMACYKFEIRYITGNKNVIADCLSQSSKSDKSSEAEKGLGIE